MRTLGGWRGWRRGDGGRAVSKRGVVILIGHRFGDLMGVGQDGPSGEESMEGDGAELGVCHRVLRSE